jgi:hypothetical protein
MKKLSKMKNNLLKITLTLGVILLNGNLLNALTVECPVFSLKDFPKVPNKRGPGNYWNDDSGNVSVIYTGTIGGVPWTGWVYKLGKKANAMTSIAFESAVVDNDGRPVCRYAIYFDNQEPGLIMNVSQNLKIPGNIDIYHDCGILGKATFDCNKGSLSNSLQESSYLQKSSYE